MSRDLPSAARAGAGTALADAPEGFTPIERWADEDIVIAGYPKSGNTWFQNLAAGVRFGVDASLLPDALLQDLIPDMHYKRFYRRYATPTIFKSHHLPQPRYRRVVYLLRDGRDAMVSYFHHLGALRGGPVDFLAMVRDGEGLFPCKWHEHVRAWRANPHGAEILTVRYEDLKRDPVRELQRFCAFAGLDRSLAMIRRAVRQCSFQEMRKKEARDGWDNAWPRDKFFIRRGKVGSYRDEMPAEALSLFLSEAGPALRECGYVEK